MDGEVAIHHRPGSFSDRWIEYCEENSIPYRKIDGLDNHVLEVIKGVDAMLWHWVFHIPGDVLSAKAVLQAAELLKIKVYPNQATCWHYDNKIGQKYLLESIGAPLAPSFVFYDESAALTWIESTTFPKVFKLSRGAGSSNVSLARDASEARTLVRKAFGRGIRQSAGYFSDTSKKVAGLKKKKDYLGALKRFPKAYLEARKASCQYPPERDYVYFQEFFPNNQYDTRITVIGKRAFGFTRNVRKNDFRASGSGSIGYDTARIDPECVRTAFAVAQKIGSQSLALDFVKDSAGRPRVVEISYCFVPEIVRGCPGHWNEQLNWISGQLWPQDAILADLLGR